MKTQLTIIAAVVLSTFSSISLAESSTPVPKPATSQSLAEGAGQKAGTAKAVKASEDGADKANEAKEAKSGVPAGAKETEDTTTQPQKDAVATEAKTNAKAAEEGTGKAHQSIKEGENPAKATKHSAEKGIEKQK